MALDQTGVRVADLSVVTSAAATDSFLVETAAGTRRIQKRNLIPDLSDVTALQNRLKTNGAEFTLDYRDGKWGWNEKPARGADTFHPFSSGGFSKIILVFDSYLTNGNQGIVSGKARITYTFTKQDDDSWEMNRAVSGASHVNGTLSGTIAPNFQFISITVE